MVSKLVKHWQTSKAYTLAIAEQMPEDGYAFKPNPEEMTFGGQLVHIAQANGFFLSKITGTPSPIGKPDKMDKASVVKLVGDSYDYVIKSIGSLTPEQIACRPRSGGHEDERPRGPDVRRGSHHPPPWPVHRLSAREGHQAGGLPVLIVRPLPHGRGSVLWR